MQSNDGRSDYFVTIDQLDAAGYIHAGTITKKSGTTRATLDGHRVKGSPSVIQTEMDHGVLLVVHAVGQPKPKEIFCLTMNDFLHVVEQLNKNA